MAGGPRVHDRAILDALESFDPKPFEKTAWRVVRKGRDPLRGAVANGRWNAIGEFEVLYTSLVPEGAVAEVGYRLSLEPVWPSRIEHEIHTLRIKADRTLIFENLQQLERLGVNIARYETFEYVSTQAIAAAAHFLEFDALIVPSARYDASNLVIFLDRLQGSLELINTDRVNWHAWRARARRQR
jgi:RES domain-containing protein